MFQGKTKAALRLLNDQSKGGVIRLNDHVDEHRTVRDILINKHPLNQLAHPDCVINEPSGDQHVLFESIDGSVIRSIALQTTGAGGPSGLDALCW